MDTTSENENKIKASDREIEQVTEQIIRDRNTRLGLRLFYFYAAFYFAFVMVNAFAPHLGEWQVAGGLNLAVVWGFALIGLAIILAVIYGFLCINESTHTKAMTKQLSHKQKEVDQ